MAAPVREPSLDQLPRACEIDEPNIPAVPDDDFAVMALQRRASDDPALALPAPRIDPRRDGREPGSPVFIIERVSGLHLRDVLRRVQRVAFLKQPAQSSCESLTDGRLSRARYAHDDRNARGLLVLMQGALQDAS